MVLNSGVFGCIVSGVVGCVVGSVVGGVAVKKLVDMAAEVSLGYVSVIYADYLSGFHCVFVYVNVNIRRWCWCGRGGGVCSVMVSLICHVTTISYHIIS